MSPENFDASDDSEEGDDRVSFGGGSERGRQRNSFASFREKDNDSQDALRGLRTLQLLGALLQHQQRQVYKGLSNERAMAGASEKVRLMNDYEAGVERVVGRRTSLNTRRGSSRFSQVGNSTKRSKNARFALRLSGSA